MMVTELNENQLDCLREALFYEEDFEDANEGTYEMWTEIPDEVVFSHYEGIVFVDDDFLC